MNDISSTLHEVEDGREEIKPLMKVKLEALVSISSSCSLFLYGKKRRTIILALAFPLESGSFKSQE